MSVVDQGALFAPLAGTGVAPRTDVVDGVAFHPAVARWFEDEFPDGPTPPQVNGWPSIADRQHTLIAAPTGSGKTLAGFLMAINDLYMRHAAGHKVSKKAQVVYISPLKALAVDIAENLDRPLSEIAAIARAMGLTAPDLRVGTRTGDTPQSVRAAMLRNPPAFVVTTPESLYLLVTSARSREMLHDVHTLIVDEIHALARDKRGSHSALTVERLDHVTKEPLVRIGLSATQKPIEVVARLLVGGQTRADGSVDCVVVDGGHQRDLDLAIELPDAELEAVASGSQMDDILDQIAELVEQHHTTLVFVNNRRMAERLAHQLGERMGNDVVAAHHGSLSKDRRFRVEHMLRAGELKCLVATASLELGIDIGPVELVCQIGSPRSIATFLQRVGRSNHTRYGTPKGRLYPLTRDELVECTGLMLAIRAGRLDAIHPPVAPLDILAQQIIAETAAEDWLVDDLFALVKGAAPYADLEREIFDEVLQLTADGVETGRGRRGAYVHYDAINGEARGRKGARLTALTSGGAIPENGDLRVVADPENILIGTVNEDWATESMAGDVFLLGTHAWQIRQVAGGVVRVVDAEGKHPTIPFWIGESPARTVELSAEVSDLRSTIDGFIEDDDLAAATEWVVKNAGVAIEVASLVVTYLATGRAILGIMPTQTDLVIERFFDESGGMQLVIHSPWGGRINRAMGYSLRKKFCKNFNFELQAAASDDAAVISLGPHHSFPLDDVPRFINPGNIRETLTQAVLDQPLFQLRWRWNLNRYLLVPRFRGGKKNPPPIQRMQADDFMAAMFPQAAACQENVTGPIEVPDHVVVRTTIHDSLTETLDVDGLIELWERLATNEVRFHFRDTTEPSTFAHEILTARPYAFLDDGEAVDRRTNAVPLRRGLPVRPSELGKLDIDAIVQVQTEIEPMPSTADELHDLLALLVVTKPRERWRPLFEQLAERGRVHAVVDGVGEWWHTTEASERVAILQTEKPVGEVFPEQVAAEVMRGHLDLHSPATPDELATITGLRASQVAVGLAYLESSGFAIQGHFRNFDNPTEVEWCSRRLLARMHSYSRRMRRGSVEASSPQDYMRFLLRWQHVAPGTQLRGAGGLGRAVEKLQGFHAPVAAWEPELLRARVSDYSQRWLDDSCHDGQTMWLRLNVPAVGEDPEPSSSSASKATPISLVFRDDLPWLLDAARGESTPPEPTVGATAEIIEALRTNGARYVAELSADTGRLATDVERALWNGVACGLITADGFAPIRGLASGSKARVRSERSLSRRRRGAPRQGHAAGRWQVIDDGARDPNRDPVVEAIAEQLLMRWGVVFYDIVAHEGLAIPWRDLQWALRRFEDRGLVKGGRFVAGFSGEQFALPEAAQGLKQLRQNPPSGERVTISACDPCNLTGVILPGPRVPAVRTNRVTYIDGVVAATVESDDTGHTD